MTMETELPQKVLDVIPEIATLEVGESVLVQCEEETGIPKMLAVGVALYGVRSKKRFAQQYMGHDLKVERVK